MVTRKQLLKDISKAKSDISSKIIQIKGARKRINFRGVRIQDQFEVGRSGIKSFGARKRRERKEGFFDLGIFNADMVGLKSTLVSSKRKLDEFDIGGGL